MERDGVSEEETIWNLILRVTLEIKEEPESVLYFTISSEYVQHLNYFVPVPWEP
jgi:hypothetical protein